MTERLKRYKDLRAQTVLCESRLKMAMQNPIAPPDEARRIRNELRLARAAERECRKDVDKLLDRLPDELRMREIMRLKYINFMTWDAISDYLMLDRRWLLRLHKRALKELEYCKP